MDKQAVSQQPSGIEAEIDALIAEFGGEPRTASKLVCLLVVTTFAGFAALVSVNPAVAQSSKGTTSPNYCGTAAVVR